jgi:hypothetical protein
LDRIQKRFEELAAIAEEIAGTKVIETRRRERIHPNIYEVEVIDSDRFLQWCTSSLALLARVFGAEDPTYDQFEKRANATQVRSVHTQFDRLVAVFLSAKDQFEGGHLYEVRNLIHAEVFSDELEQADYFLQQSYKSPAAVIAGVVLETTLRKLCEQTDDVEPGDKLNRMNDDLAKAAVYNKMRADQVRAWAKIRNDAAHGNPDGFSEKDVELMIQGVRDFVANQLS